jgi:hypothetical protein
MRCEPKLLSRVRTTPTLPVLLGFLLSGAGCSPNQPPRWVEGGAPLVIAPARWDRGDDDTIEILQNGQVLEDGDKIFLVDRAGRIVDDDNEPVAILLPDGFVAGTDNRLLGRVGVANAAPPNAAAAWLAVMPNGQVVYFDDEGERSSDGAWRGCNGPQLRTCTLITHVIALRKWSQRSQGGVTFGVGIGVGL